MVAGGVKFLNLNKVIALVISSAVALFWNFAWSKYVIWRGVTSKQINEIAEEITE